MPKIYKYQKVIDEYTTYTAIDNEEGDKRITELCTIGNDTYISVPDGLTLPEQPKQIILELVTMTKDLKRQIEEGSSHIQLIKKRVRERIREKYPLEEELQILRDKINGKGLSGYTTYNNYIEKCIVEGNSKKKELIYWH